jgi:hypothetical protein
VGVDVQIDEHGEGILTHPHPMGILAP